MSLVGKIYNTVSKYLGKKEDKRPGIDVVTGYEKKHVTKLNIYLPWSYYVRRWFHIDGETRLEECIVVQKNGSIQQTYAFRGQDIESFSYDYVAMIYEYFNSQIKRLGDGWMVSCEAQRFRMHDYPAADFESVAGFLVDRIREREFRQTGEHFDSSYYLTFVYKPENEIKKKVTNFFFKEENREIQIETEIKEFQKIVENMTSVLAGRMIIRPLDCHETVCFLHSTCSTTRHDFILPRTQQFLFLDTFISDCKMEVGKCLKLGDYYIPIVEVFDFPTTTYPAVLNELNKLNIEYRWVSRFFPLGKEQALKELVSYQQQAAAGKTSTKQMATEFALGVKDNLENHAGAQAQNEAEMAQEDVGGDRQGLGYYNSCVMVWDEDYYNALEKAKKVRKLIERCMFSCKLEEMGPFDAFLGMLAGNVTSDVRRPLVTTGNFAHTLPFSAIWTGIERNRHLNELCGVDKPLITCSTEYGANFYLNLNDGEVGHTLILGPTGAGKSTFLNLIAVSALKYPDVQVFFMDYGLSTLTLTLAVGGTYINAGRGGVSFQPLRDVHIKSEFQWGINFIITLIEMQGIEVNATMKVAISAAMEAVVESPVELRTLTTFCLNLQYVDRDGHKVLHDALSQYLIEGRYGEIFDGDHTTLGNDRWVLFEMEQIMNLGPDCSGPALLFIFHFLESSFTGRLTFFFMDECWFGLENPAIAAKMREYLLTLRKKNVFCIFATQNPSAVANSSLASTIVQNCPTHIFLADPKAREESLSEDYRKLGLSNEEISLLADSVKKLDYYLKCPSGTRKFQLSLSDLELVLFKGKESKFKYRGKIMNWDVFQQYLLKIRDNDGHRRAMVDYILEAWNVDYLGLLDGFEQWRDNLWVS